MKLGIVGAEGAKFTQRGEENARSMIRQILEGYGATAVVSGACHLGGIDVWAAEIGRDMGLEVIEFPPKRHSWSGGYKPRNIKIAETCEALHNFVVAELPEDFKGMRFKRCYHCDTTLHVKSGGCWTMNYAQSLGKEAFRHVVWN